MARSDRTFFELILSAITSGAVLAVPLAITLFPGVFEEALHGYESVVQTCAAALYMAGRELPPLGIVVVALAASALAAAGFRGARLIQRTVALERAREEARVSAELRSAASRLDIGDQVRAFDSVVPAAYTAGLFSPRIWISTAALERLGPAELEAVLRHERFHLRHRDPLRIVIARMLAAVLFTVPVMRARCLRFEVAKELDADLEAVAALGAPAVAGALVAFDGQGAPSLVAVGAWSLAGLRIDQLERASAADLLPRAAPAARWLSTAMLVLALALASGQAIRANLVPVGFFAAIGMASTAASVHECPLPMEGVLF